MEQQIALGVTLGLLALVTLAFALVIRRSSREGDQAGVQEKAYRLRSRLFVVVSLLVLPTMLLTLFDLPYARALMTEDPLQVHATGRQWHWSIEPDVLPAGVPVVFHVTSADVNHGFGIYDERMRLVAQTQAMPGYVNRLAHTFEEPGTYQVLCMEYCGAAHHAMMGKITVQEAASK